MLGEEQLGHLHLRHRAVRAAPSHLLTLLDGSLHHPAERESAEIRIRVEVGDPSLQGRSEGEARRRHMGEHRLEERAQVAGRL